jgi:RHS repeat-associated protein
MSPFPFGQYTYTYDNEGNLVNKTGKEGGITYSYDYTYDFRNRLTEAKKTRLPQGIVAADDTFTYDVFDRRIGKLAQFGTQQWTVYDGDNAYADFSGQTLTTRYLFTNGPDEIVARTNASGNSTAWYLTDNIGSVRQIVDASGSNLYHVNYFTFGGIVPGSESGTGGDRFKFAGREWDSEVGLYYNRARYYDPTTGRFISEDRLRFLAGDPNLYRYSFNGPTVSTDPSGLLVDSVRVGVVTNPGLAAVVAEGLTGVGGGAAVAGAVGKAGLITIAVCKGLSILANSAKDEEPDIIPKQVLRIKRAIRNAANELRGTDPEDPNWWDIFERLKELHNELREFWRRRRGFS